MNTKQEALENSLLNSSDEQLLQIISNSANLYRDEVIQLAIGIAKSRGLISNYPDKEFKVITAGGRENGPLDVELIKEIYLKDLINDESLVHVSSCNQWLSLKNVFDTTRWKNLNTEQLDNLQTNKDIQQPDKLIENSINNKADDKLAHEITSPLPKIESPVSIPGDNINFNIYTPVETNTWIGNFFERNDKVLKWIIILIAGISTATFLFLGVGTWLDYRKEQSKIAEQQNKVAATLPSFNGFIDQYITTVSQFDQTSTYNKRYINGKAIVINKNEKTIDPIFFQLPDEIRANSPDEVGTVFLLDYDKKIVGTYGYGPDAVSGFAHSVTVSTYDTSQKALIDHPETFVGSDPPSGVTKNIKKEVWGKVPERKITAYIQGLKEGRTIEVSNESPPVFINAKLFELIGYLIIIVIGAILTWAGTRWSMRQMSKKIGRELHGETELTSINAWMESPREKDKTTK